MDAMFSTFYVLAAVLIFLACYVGDSLAQKALVKNGHKALAAASALPFGLGGREFAGRMLKKLEDSVSVPKAPEK